MKANDARQDLELRAAAALKAVLGEVSTIKVREIRRQSAQDGRGLMAFVDVFGHHHTLACEVQSDGQPGHLRTALAELRSGAGLHGNATPVIIAPYFSPEAQAWCKENKTGYVDFEGNARLALGEVFIVKRTHPHRGERRSAWPADRSVGEKFRVPSSSRSTLQHAEA